MRVTLTRQETEAVFKLLCRLELSGKGTTFSVSKSLLESAKQKLDVVLDERLEDAEIMADIDANS